MKEMESPPLFNMKNYGKSRKGKGDL